MKQNVYSVSSLVRYIKQSLDNDLLIQSTLIKGEISNFTNHRSGHWYFTLKDKQSKIPCIMFSSHASRSKILLKEGMSVIVSASVSMYEAGGTIQLYVTKVQIDGLGDLFLQLEQVKETLIKEGIFDPAHKKALPTYPRNIGVISAKTGAAIQDILTTIARRWPIAHVEVYPSLVQGVQATEAIIENLKRADKGGHDVILLARGGGSIEDLWCFNEEALVRCIYAMNCVLVSGIGHESDTTLVDYVSDARAATPTAAAELITPDIQEVYLHVMTLRSRMSKAMNAHLRVANEKYAHLKQHRYITNPLSYIQHEQLRFAMDTKALGVVEHLRERLVQKLSSHAHQFALHSKWYCDDKRQRLLEQKYQLIEKLEHYKLNAIQQRKENASLLDAYSPLKIVSRGYHMSYIDKRLVKHIEDVQIDDEIQIHLQDGIVTSIVTKKEKV